MTNRLPKIPCHFLIHEPPHEKTNKTTVYLTKTRISLGIRPLQSESSLSAWRKLGSLATHWAHSEDSDQTGRMPRLIWVFPGCKVILLVLSCCGSHNDTAVHLSMKMQTSFHRKWNLKLSHLMRLWHFSSSVNSFFNMHGQPSSGARCLIFGRTLSLLPYVMCANSEGSGDTVWMRRLAWAFGQDYIRMRRLAWAFPGRLCDYHNLMSWLNLCF